MAIEAITTIKAKRKMLLARAGIQDLPPISQMVFGTGGVDEYGDILEIKEDQEDLRKEIYRKDIEKTEIISDTEIQYACTLEEGELTGAEINEIALADIEGDLLTIKNFKTKGKDIDFSITFKINDKM